MKSFFRVAGQRRTTGCHLSFLWGAICILVTACLPSNAQAASNQAYPTNPVRWIMPYPIGGSIDIVARIIGQKLSGGRGEQLVVDNRSGAGGRRGTEMGAVATPDGYTQMLTVNTALATEGIVSRGIPGSQGAHGRRRGLDDTAIEGRTSGQSFRSQFRYVVYPQQTGHFCVPWL